jgi:hypothetical protein
MEIYVRKWTGCKNGGKRLDLMAKEYLFVVDRKNFD